MEVSTINLVLGQRAGVLELVFGLLLPRDMKNVVLVCRLWREVGEDPRFWAWVVIRVTRRNMITVPERLESRRMRAVRELRVTVEVSEEVLQAMARHQGLRVVKMATANLSLLEPGQLAMVVARSEEVDLFGTQLVGQQLKALLTAISSGDSRLKKLAISVYKLSSFDLRLLSNAVNRLEEVELWGLDLTLKPWEEFMTSICEGGSRLKKMDISNSNMSTVDASLLARAVNRLEEVDMSEDTEITKEQVEAILTQSLMKTSLRCLKMGNRWQDFGLDEHLVERARFAIGELV